MSDFVSCRWRAELFAGVGLWARTSKQLKSLEIPFAGDKKEQETTIQVCLFTPMYVDH